MAVAFDAKSSAAGTGTSTSFTNSTNLTVGSGSNRALIGILTISNTPTATMTWNGVSMTLLGSQAASDSSTKTFLFGLRNPASGTLALAGTIGSSQDFVFAAVSFTGVEQSSDVNAFTNAANAQGAATPASVSITSAVGNMTVAGFSAGGVGNPSNFSATSGTNIFLATVGGGSVGGAGAYASGAASVTMTGTYTIANPNVAVGVNVVAAAAATIPLGIQGLAASECG